MLALIEEERRQDQDEVGKMREQLTIFKNEYVFYKKESEMLSMRLRDETEGLSLQVREHKELEKDFRIRLAELERENQELQQYTR